MSKKPVTKKDFVPSDLMRARRPYLFSDSRTVEAPTLAREVFEYQLETLTKRKEETKFEHFARRLAEKEICPNLLPQTGPTGGGDSKVDAETYPVAGDIAQTWYTGIDQSAAHDRWAFAFSAKKEWLPKVKSDVEKIAGTGRDYKRIFFITNQFVPDKQRAATEDELTRKFGIPLTILDRSWIKEKVFSNNRVALAIETLGLTTTANDRTGIKGPNDTERESELRELDAQIEDPARYQGVQYQLAEDCLQSAILARGLERPRLEIDGRFDRAERIAEKVEHTQQRLRISYARAWTVFWWYDDFDELNRLYGRVEGFAKDSEQAEDVELLFNLWQILRSSVMQGRFKAEDAQLDSRTTTLKAALDRLAGNASRPNNAMIARTDRLVLDLAEALGDTDRTTAALNGLREVAESSDHLVNYPIDKLSEMLAEIGDAFAGNTAFDELFEKTTEIVARRRGDGQAGEAYLRRGMQKLRADLPYEAIRYFGRAQHKLAKREYRAELVQSLVGACAAYEEVGLLWAARSSLITAAHYALSEFHENGAIIKPALAAVEKLAWLELQLGRVPCVLAWSELADVLARHIEASEGRREGADEARQSRDIIAGMLLLRSDMRQLAQAGFLVGVLQSLGLPQASMALMYALGHEERMRKDGWIPNTETAADVLAFFCKLLEHPAARDLPDRPELLSDASITLRTNVLGCLINVAVENNLQSIYLAEALLGSLEAFLATSLSASIFPYRESFTITIESTPATLKVPTREDVSTDHIKISHSVPTHSDSVESQSAYSDWMMETVVHVLTKIALIDDAEAYIAQIVGDERGYERSINNAHIATLMTNIMGSAPKLRLSDWRKGFDGELFPPARAAMWNADCPSTGEPDSKAPASEPVFGTGEPPPELLDMERGKHGDRRVHSLIDIPLWNKARWNAVAFLNIPPSHGLPVLALGFLDREAASAIFSGWRRRFGDVDRDEDIRVSILTGISKTEPAAYRVVIGTKLKADAVRNGLIVMASRIQSMHPTDAGNLENFLRLYAATGRYYLAPAHYRTGAALPDFMLDLAIGKRELIVRPLWQVGDNDPDFVGVRPDDDPILPEGVEDIPVLRALARKRKRRDE